MASLRSAIASRRRSDVGSFASSLTETFTCFLPIGGCGKWWSGSDRSAAERTLQFGAQLGSEQLADPVDQQRHLVSDQADVTAR